MSEAETEINIALTAAHAGPNWSNDTLGWILYLIALMMVRSQQQRENRRRPVAQIAEMLLENPRRPAKLGHMWPGQIGPPDELTLTRRS